MQRMNQYQSNGDQSYFYQQQTGLNEQLNYNNYANNQQPTNQQTVPQNSSFVQKQLPNQPPKLNPISPVDQNNYGALNKNMETLSLNSPENISAQPPINEMPPVKSTYNQQYLSDQNSSFNNKVQDQRVQDNLRQQYQTGTTLQAQLSNSQTPPNPNQTSVNKSYSPQLNGNQQYFNNPSAANQLNQSSLDKNLPGPTSFNKMPQQHQQQQQSTTMQNRYPTNQPPQYYGQQPPLNPSQPTLNQPNQYDAHQMMNQATQQQPPINQMQHQQLPPTALQNRYPTTNQPPQYYGQRPLNQPMQQQYYGQPQLNQYDTHQMMNQQAQQPPKQLNPDSIPSVIQVIQDDKDKFYNAEMTYYTSVPSDSPPNETTINDVNLNNGRTLKVIDRGCSRPNHMRSSIYHVPVNEDMLKNTSIPFNIVIKPFDEFEIETSENRIEVPISQSEIIRCNRCKTYISPFMRFTDGGRRFQCAMCHHVSEVTNSYYVPLDHTEQRLDKFQRPELHLGSYEFRTNEEFYRNKVMASRRPHIVFAFELTMNSRPLIQLISANLADVIRNSLPYDQALNCPPPLVGFITYNSKIQLYDVLNNGTSHIISDVASTFPSFTTFLIDPIKHMDKIEEFLAKLPTLYSDNELETETILGPVIEAAFQTCNADSSNWFPNQEVKDKSKVLAVGKIYLFHCSLPTFGQDGATPGRLKKRWTTVDEEAKRLLGTDKEKNILTPEPSKYYTKLGQKCVTDYGSAVELFLFPPVNGSFLDIATISELTRLTGTGGIYKYFNDYSPRFIQDLKQSLRSTMAFDVLLKVRTSTGIRPVDYVGNFYSRSVSDIEVASLSAGNSISVEFKYDDKLDENEFVIVQIATLYTAVSGDRRVRIHNLALPTCSQLADVFRGANCDALINHLFRSSIQSLRLGLKTIQDVKNQMINRVVQILTSYRRNCASPTSSPGQLILPETLKLLPVYITGAIKCDAIDGGFEMMPDDKAFAQARSLGANCSYSQVILYPNLLKLQYDQNDKLEAVPLRSAFYRLSTPDGVAYVLENGFYLFLYLPANPEIINQPKFIQNVFGVHSLNDIHPEKELPQLDTDESLFLHNLLDSIRKKRKMAMKVYIVRQNIDKNELIFKCFLYEDKKPLSSVTSGHSNFEAPSYVDLLCHLHKEIRALIQ